ncbi:Rne/Rng family ribonuclease [Roseomonas elaeocarpi]|uniref:Ribonuclease E n=2 Tax=Roseomonas elaeocarpi TaxID=907779 RepID=A0ABV6JSA1_9PROT
MDGNRIEDFDVEAADRLPLKGNIYLAKVVRVEPSLQAAFVEYGGNRHGFLAFSEIHPDYYQIPTADRQRLLEMQAQEEEEDDEAELDTAAERPAPDDDRDLRRRNREGGREGGRDDRRGSRDDRRNRRRDAGPARNEVPIQEGQPPESASGDVPGEVPEEFTGGSLITPVEPGSTPAPEAPRTELRIEPRIIGAAPTPATVPASTPDAPSAPEAAEAQPAAGSFDSLTGTDLPPPAEATASSDAAGNAAPAGAPSAEATPAEQAPHQTFGEAIPEEGSAEQPRGGRAQPMSMHVDQVVEEAPAAPDTLEDEEPAPETIGGDENGEGPSEERSRERRSTPRFMRHYKIQEVIRRRQILLVQVVKEERGNKGAALTTYISLAGRFSVLMPNSPRGGGVSRKITQVADRKRLREAVDEMNLPKGMSIIVRTAGAQRPKPEIRRDGEYLLRLWDDIRERTMASTAPALIYEEADLIKRAIRDTYGREVEDIEVEGEQAWKQAREFMRMIMPQHERRIRLYRDPSMPLFARAGAEQQLDAMMSPVVQLKSGGYIVINQTEALVAIDVNSGRATRDRHIEDTALRTNCEAADEIARQLRLRDLAGLIVIDFIDMESSRHDAQVERRIKDALRSDRARIQVGRISHFGLLEMSRQRLRPSLTEHAFMTCPHCQGRGIVRSLESSALHVLRAIEEEGAKRRASEIVVHAAEPVAMHLLNRKRDRLAGIETRHAMAVLISGDHALSEAQFRIERTRAQTAPAPQPLERAPALRMDYAPEAVPEPEEILPEPAEEVAEEGIETGVTPESETEESRAENRRRRRRRRGGRRENGDTASETASDEEGQPGAEAPAAEADAVTEAAPEEPAPAEAAAEATEGAAEGRGRGRRRRGGRRRPEDGSAAPEADKPEEPVRRYAGPTPADPFGGNFDPVFDALAAAEAVAEAAARRATVPAAPAADTAQPMEAQPTEAQAVPAEAAPVPADDLAPANAAAELSQPAAQPEGPEPLTAEPARAEPPVTSDATVADTAPSEAHAAEAPVTEMPVVEAAPSATHDHAPATGPDAAPVEAARAEATPAEPAQAEPAPAAPAQAAPAQVAPAQAEATSASVEPVVGEPVRPVVLDGATQAPRRAGWWKR